jgi:hypothetical protein
MVIGVFNNLSELKKKTMVNRKLGDKDMIVAQQDEVGGRFPVALE